MDQIVGNVNLVKAGDGENREVGFSTGLLGCGKRHYEMPIVVKKREQTKLEESFNGISHGVGLLAAILATPFMILESIRIGDAGFIVGASIFCSTVILLYLTSSIYHFLNQGKAKRVFRVFDHCAIFLLIAGSYTPFTLGVFRGALGRKLPHQVDRP